MRLVLPVPSALCCVLALGCPAGPPGSARGLSTPPAPEAREASAPEASPRNAKGRSPRAPAPDEALVSERSVPRDAAPAPSPEATDFAGHFAGDGFDLRLEASLEGELRIGRRGPFPVRARAAGTELTADFLAEGRRYPFRLRHAEHGLILHADGRDYRLRERRGPAVHPPPPGTYAGALNGRPARLLVSREGPEWVGEATSDLGDRYWVRVGADGRGFFRDAERGRSLPCTLVSAADGALLTVLARGLPPARASFRRGPTAPRPRDERDPALVGAWIRADASSRVLLPTLRFGSDGRYAFGTSRALRRDEAQAPRGPQQGSVATGAWRTEDGALLTRPSGATRWALYARYSFEGSRLLLRGDDGRTEVWVRRP
ncbi:MAG: hypothetical protein D6731_00810 [Planctomycetota bacterium]|nr:MAG: hypothetical protein D6731_00810 [Planctomycetota bacterium]